MGSHNSGGQRPIGPRTWRLWRRMGLLLVALLAVGAAIFVVLKPFGPEPRGLHDVGERVR